MEKMDNSGAVIKLLFVRRWGIFDSAHFGGVPFPLIAVYRTGAGAPLPSPLGKGDRLRWKRCYRSTNSPKDFI